MPSCLCYMRPRSVVLHCTKSKHPTNAHLEQPRQSDASKGFVTPKMFCHCKMFFHCKMLEIFANFFQKFSSIVSKNEKNCQKNGHLGPENGQKFAVFGSENQKIRQNLGMKLVSLSCCKSANHKLSYIIVLTTWKWNPNSNSYLMIVVQFQLQNCCCKINFKDMQININSW